MDDDFGLLFRQLQLAHFNACLTALSARGLKNIGSPRLLVQLAQYPDDPDAAPSQKELASQLHSSPATIATSLKSLERAGYVTRRTDARDTRRNRIFITKKGRDTVEASKEAFRQVDQHMYAGFSPEERELVKRFHQRMLDNLYLIVGDACVDPCAGRELGQCLGKG